MFHTSVFPQIKGSKFTNYALAAIVGFTGVGIMAESSQAAPMCVTEQNIRQCVYPQGNGTNRVVSHVNSTGQWLFDVNIYCQDMGSEYKWAWQGQRSTSMTTSSDLDSYSSNFCSGYLK